MKYLIVVGDYEDPIIAEYFEFPDDSPVPPIGLSEVVAEDEASMLGTVIPVLFVRCETDGVQMSYRTLDPEMVKAAQNWEPFDSTKRS